MKGALVLLDFWGALGFSPPPTPMPAASPVTPTSPQCLVAWHREKGKIRTESDLTFWGAGKQTGELSLC